MDQEPTAPETHEFILKVDGLARPGAVAAVREALRGLDPGAEVEADPAHESVTVRIRADSLEVAQAIARAGFEARAMTG